MLQVLNAAREAGVRVFYALHHRYRPGDYETWKYIAPIQKAAWVHKTFEYGAWGGEIRPEFRPKSGEIVATVDETDKIMVAVAFAAAIGAPIAFAENQARARAATLRLGTTSFATRIWTISPR
jgi:hypothetical protein